MRLTVKSFSAQPWRARIERGARVGVTSAEEVVPRATMRVLRIENCILKV